MCKYNLFSLKVNFYKIFFFKHASWMAVQFRPQHIWSKKQIQNSQPRDLGPKSPSECQLCPNRQIKLYTKIHLEVSIM